MKKLLALVLALVMTMSLATITSNAAYSDQEDVSLDEAVAVMSAVGVFQGADGKFSPKEVLTREQAAKLIAYLDLGEKVAESLPAVKVFSDVAADRWSAKYIAYCADAGYIAGVGDGKFDPAGQLTGYAFAKMILCVLGYNANIEGYLGNSWQIAISKKMQSLKLDDKVQTAASAALTREAAAQYCFNALKAKLVGYETKGTSISINGAEIATGASSASEHYSVEPNATLWEHLFADLTCDEAKDGNTDHFGRPANTWYNDGEEIDTYVTETPVATYTASVKGGELYTALGKPKAPSFTVIQNGVVRTNVAGDLKDDVVSGNKDSYGANGQLIEIYQDKDDEGNKIKGHFTVVVVDTYLATITKWTKAELDKNGDVISGKKENVTLSLTYISGENGATTTVNNLTYNTTDFEKQDATDKTKVLVTGYVGDDGKLNVASAVPAEFVEDVKVTAYKSSTNVTADGETYKYAYGYTGNKTSYDMKNDTFTFYFDNYGYVIGRETYSEADSTDYYFVNKSSNLKENGDFDDGDLYATLQVIDMEGNASTIKALQKNISSIKDNKNLAKGDSTGLANKIVTVKEDTKNNGYSKITVVGSVKDNSGYLTGDVTKLTKTQPTIDTNKGIKTNAKTVFVLNEGTEDTADWNAYTGIASVPGYEKKGNNTLTAYAVLKDNYASVVFIDLTKAESSSNTVDELIYFLTYTSTSQTSYNDDGDQCYVFEAIVDGEKVDVNVATNDLNGDDANPAHGDLFKITKRNSDGVVTELTVAKDSDKYWANGSVAAKALSFSDPSFFVGNVDFATDGDTVAYIIDGEGELEVGTAADLDSNENAGAISIVYVAKDNHTVASIYFQEAKAN